MECILFISLIFIIAVDQIHACHYPIHGVDPDSRKKRSTNAPSSDYSGHNASFLIDYFTSCMINRKSNSFDWFSSTVWTINDSNWYYYTNNIDCADEDYDNETNCWLSNVDNLFDESLSVDVKECIEQFAIDNNFPVDNTAEKRRKKRFIQSLQLVTNIVNKILPPNPGCPSIPSAYNTELERLASPRRGKNGRSFTIENVATFIDLYTVCTECERYSGEAPVDCYANRFNQLTRLDSAVKPAIQVSNSRYANGGKTVGNCRRNVYMTDWFDNPLTSDGDDQSLSLLQQQHPNSICHKPDGIQAELSTSRKPFGRGNNSLTISPRHGLVCLDSNQTEGSCENYRVRFCCKDFVGKCPLRNSWTSYFNGQISTRIGEIENLLTISQGNRGRVCSNPTGVSARLTSGLPYQLTNDNVELTLNRGLTCIPSIQDESCGDYELRYCCPSKIGTCGEEHKWTKWLKGKSSKKGYDGTIKHFSKSRKWKCTSTPSAIQVQLAKSRRPYVEGGNKFKTLSPEQGALCLNKNQKNKKYKCKKYRVKFCCLRR